MPNRQPPRRWQTLRRAASHADSGSRSTWAPMTSRRFPIRPPASMRRADGIPHGQIGDGDYDSKSVGTTPQDAGLHAAGLLEGQEVPGAVSPARHRRRRDGVAAFRHAQRPPRQPDRRRQGRADDRRDAQRPGAEERPGGRQRLRHRARVRRLRAGPAEGRDPGDRVALLRRRRTASTGRLPGCRWAADSR